MATQEISGITIEKGTDFSVSFAIDAFDGTPLDVENFTPIAKIRKYPSSKIYHSFVATVLGSTGYVLLKMDKDTTTQLSPGRNYFDVLLTNDYETVKAIKGTMFVEETAAL